jgi:predicted transcriptional regulator of viral defense system
MSDLADSPSPDQRFFEQVLAELSARLLIPSEELPGVRCASNWSLTRLLKDIVRTLDAPGFRDVSARTLIGRLVEAGILVPLKLEKSIYHLYGVGLGIDVNSFDPIELLQASIPSGIVCYFTALQVHNLTTQIPPHHHIARRTSRQGQRSTLPESKPVRAPSTSSTYSVPSTQPRLGTVMFVWQGVSYYETKRDVRWLQATQWRYLNEKSQYQVTTLEQTLLDTLHRPASCGGPSVVFEAWETALEQINSDRLATLLQQIDDDILARRVGYMLTMLDYTLSPNLVDIVQQAQRTASFTDAAPLFAGMPYHRFDATWNLWVE